MLANAEWLKFLQPHVGVTLLRDLEHVLSSSPEADRAHVVNAHDSAVRNLLFDYKQKLADKMTDAHYCT